MSLSSDNFAALIYLRDQARKWKNITFVTSIIVFVILVKVMFLRESSHNNIHDSDNYIASIDIEGIIFKNKYRSEILEDIAKKDNIKALIVNINSPGGSIVASEVLYNELLEISKKKPVVAVLESVAASGGYMAAIAANHIISYNGTLTGSVGVIMQSTEITEMANKVGIKFNNYKSSPLKGAPSPFEKTNPKIDMVVGQTVNDSYRFFADLVLDRRKNKIKETDHQKVTDGRIFNGRQALKIGLVDQVGGKKDATLYLKKNHNIKDTEVKQISIKKPGSRFFNKMLNHIGLADISHDLYHDNKRLMAIW